VWLLRVRCNIRQSSPEMNKELNNRGFHDFDHLPRKIGGQMNIILRLIWFNPLFEKTQNFKSRINRWWEWLSDR
jgi:hypothetical protein